MSNKYQLAFFLGITDPEALKALPRPDTQKFKVLYLLSDYRWHDTEEIIDVAGSESGMRRLREIRAELDRLVIQKESNGPGSFKYKLFHL